MQRRGVTLYTSFTLIGLFAGVLYYSRNVHRPYSNFPTQIAYKSVPDYASFKINRFKKTIPNTLSNF